MKKKSHTFKKKALHTACIHFLYLILHRCLSSWTHTHRQTETDRHTHRQADTHSHVYTHTRLIPHRCLSSWTHTRARTHTHMCVCVSDTAQYLSSWAANNLRHSLSLTHTDTHTRTHTYPSTHPPANTNPNTHTHTYPPPPTHTHNAVICCDGMQKVTLNPKPETLIPKPETLNQSFVVMEGKESFADEPVCGIMLPGCASLGHVCVCVCVCVCV